MQSHKPLNWGTARIHHYIFRGGLGEALDIRKSRGAADRKDRKTSETVVNGAVVTQPDSRQWHSLNVVSDPTLVSIMEEYPELLVPAPPEQRRAMMHRPGGGFCLEGIQVFGNSTWKLVQTHLL